MKKRRRRIKQTDNVYKRVFLSVVLVASVMSFLLFLETESSFTDRFTNFVYNYNNFDSRPLSRIELFGVGALEDGTAEPKLSDEDVIRRSFVIQPDERTLRSLKSQETDIITISNDTHDIPSNTRFLLVARMYEQLGKSLEEYIQAAAVAKSLDRFIVTPFLQDSYISGLPVNSEGKALKSFDDLFDTDVANLLLSSNGYAEMVTLDQFLMYCDKTVQKTTVVHFLYSLPEGKEVTRKEVRLSDREYDTILRRIDSAGYTDCSFLDNRFAISKRLSKIRPGRQLCVNPEIIRSLRDLESKVLRDDSCVVFVDWRGLGEQTTHFQPTVKTSPKQLVHQLHFSSLIDVAASDFIHKNLSGENYISVHVRSERQILWYGFDRLRKCIDLVSKFIDAIKARNSKLRVFLATDMLDSGSNTIPKDPKMQAELKSTHDDLVKRLNAVEYTPIPGEDSGLTALIEMNILTNGVHFISLGTGAIQEWAVDGFMTKHNSVFGPIIKRVCYKEVNARALKSK